jgi:hypothetical protein
MKRSFLIYGAGGYLLEKQSNMDGRQELLYER